jgi:hypothetical protein
MFSTVLQFSLGFSWKIAAGVLLLLALVPRPQGVMSVGVLKELWTGEIINKFRFTGEFLSRIASRNEFVNNNAIHIADMGVDPEVLINNTSYPIAITTRTDEDIVIALDKYDSTNTAVTDDELYALPYDKEGSVIEQHRIVLEQKAILRSAYNLAPQIDTSKTPLIMTSGITNHDVSTPLSNGLAKPGYRMTWNDVIAAGKRMDDMFIPQAGRILVLSNQHKADLLTTDERFRGQYKDATLGTILNMYGFDIYAFMSNPQYAMSSDTVPVLTKKAFGAVSNPATDQDASFFFYAPRAAQARGAVKMYYRIAGLDPENRQTVVGFKLWHICLPKKTEGFGAIVTNFIPST